MLTEESKKRYDKMNDIYNVREKYYSNSSSTIQKLTKDLEKTLYICSKIREIPFFYLYFQPIHIANTSMSFINSKLINSKSLTDIPLEYWEKINSNNQSNNQNSNKYVLIDTSFKMTNSLYSYSYDAYFTEHCICNNKKALLAQFFDICLFVLDAIYNLQKHGLLLMYFSKSNICFNQFGNPFIQNFTNCIEKSCIKHTDIPIHKDGTIETYIICYLNKNPHIQSLSHTQIELICQQYIESHPIISNISLDIKKKYYDDTVKYLQPLKNKSISYILEFLLKYIDTWDNYGVDIFQLNNILFDDLLQIVTEDSKQFWKGFVNIFMKNILCNPNERHNIQQTKHNVLDYLQKNIGHIVI